MAQLVFALDQHLHVDDVISHVHKEADRIYLDERLHKLIDDDHFDEERNGLLFPLQD